MGNPLINEDHALSLKLLTPVELTIVRTQALKINEILKSYFAEIDIYLVDFKIEFGRLASEIVLADEISPDKSRLWDAQTGEQLDKDRFRRDMGDVKEAYEKILVRLISKRN